MQKVALVVATVLFSGRGARVRPSEVDATAKVDSLATLLAAGAPGFHIAPAGRLASMHYPRRGQSVMDSEENSDKAKTIGAAALGGALAVQLTQDLWTAVVWALLGAYLSTLSNGVGDATKSAGSLAATAYGKTLDINEQYEVLPKAKSAADTVLTVADNVNTNYRLSAQLDEKIGLSPKLEALTDRIDGVKGKVQDKVDELNEASKGGTRRGDVKMMAEEPDGEATTIGAAALGGIIGVQVFGGLSSAVVLALLAGYTSTLDNGIGDVTKSAGGLAAKAYGKTLDINEQYELLPKAKTAVDTVVTVADNVNRNYRLTERLDEKIGLSPRLETLSAKIDDVKGSVSAKADELKAASRGGDIKMMAGGEPSDRAITVGAAALGAAAGVQLTGELTTSVLLAALAAYASTLNNGVGDVTKSAGSLAAKAYDKTVEINEQYEVLPKAKSAADTVVTVADNVNRNYRLTEQLDAKIGISPKLEALSDKLDGIKGQVTSKADELKAATETKTE